MPSNPSRKSSVRLLRRRPSVARSKRASTRDPRSSVCEHALRTPSSPTRKLANLRVAVLDHLKDLETRLSQLEFPPREMGDSSSPVQSLQMSRRTRSSSIAAIDDARARIDDGLKMLDRIRADVCSHLPDRPVFDFLPEFSLEDVRSHFPSFELPDLDLHLPAAPFAPSLDDVFLNLDKLQSPLSYLPTLGNHLESLHEHILSLELPSSIPFNLFAPPLGGRICELIYKLQDPDLFTDPLKSPLDFLGEPWGSFDFNKPESLENKAVLLERQIDYGLVKSHYGDRLILFQDLPQRYQNDEFVLSGYRFIPLFRWPLLVLSIFQFHNETANIWTHLIPLILSLTSLSSSFLPSFHFAQSNQADLAENAFAMFANVCLISSCVWHVMSGCAHNNAMETAARVDYVGIGWLISASIGSIVYYGFGCLPQPAAVYLSVSFALGVAGSILPFMPWFNDRQNKKWRIMFFLSLVFTLIIPLAHLAALHSIQEMYTFIQPEFPSLAAYAVGLIFYAFHFPECAIPPEWARFSDWFGGGSHAIWHLFTVLAITLHKNAMVEYRGGIGNEACTLSWGQSGNVGTGLL